MQYVPPGVSDHSPLIIKVCDQVRNRAHPFRFRNHVADHDDFLKIVREEWEVGKCGSMMRVWLTMNRIKKKLKKLHKEKIGKAYDKVLNGESNCMICNA